MLIYVAETHGLNAPMYYTTESNFNLNIDALRHKFHFLSWEPTDFGMQFPHI
jgi:hypothetical protein